MSSEEKRALERAQMDIYSDIRRAAEAHRCVCVCVCVCGRVAKSNNFMFCSFRQTRKHIQKFIKPGMRLIDVCERIENTARKLVGECGLEAGK